MTAKNDVTGDSIHSRVPSKEYKDNYDKIFGKKEEKKEPEEWPDNPVEGGRIT